MPNRSLPWLTLDAQRSANQASAVAHADQATAFFDRFGVEALAFVDDLDVKGRIHEVRLEVNAAALGVQV
jgi:hypothetical protein